MDYKNAYEKEKERCVYLADRLSQVEEERDVLQARLDHIHNSAFWKMSKPFRKAIHFFIRQASRVRRVLHPRDLIKKLKYKKRERQASLQFGTASFPDRTVIAAQ
ncbi:MAG: hypothetical protein K2H12_10405 [Acetatifactor sp.]|nr:hypothetical protein [Acetatifactor sp.]